MNYSTATATLELGSSFTQEDIKNAYRKLAQSNHPDKGGNADTFKSIKASYDFLKNITISSVQKTDWDAIHKSHSEKSIQLRDTIKETFDVDAFVKHFESFSNQKINYTIKEFGGEKRSTDGGINVKFFNDDNTVVFTFRASGSTLGNHTGALSSNDDISFNIFITAFGYANRKKQKMAQRDWNFDNNHKVLKDPKVSFSNAKLKKIFAQPETTAMKKADMELALKYELNAEFVNDVVFIPLGDDDYLKVYRMVFNRTPAWSICNISHKTSYTYRAVNTMVSCCFAENSDFVDQLHNLVKLNNVQDIIKYLEEYKTAKF